MLTLGVLATLGANIGYGAPYGWSGELLSGWPAVAFVGSVEMVLSMVRRARTAPATGTAVPEPPAGLNGHAEKAAELFADDLAVGTVPGVRKIRGALNVGQPKAQQVREYLTGLAASNGHRGGDALAP